MEENLYDTNVLIEMVRKGVAHIGLYTIFNVLEEYELTLGGGFVSAKSLPKVVHDKESDSLYIVLAEGFEEGFIELAPNISLEIGEGGKIIGIEILRASKLFREGGYGSPPIHQKPSLKPYKRLADIPFSPWQILKNSLIDPSVNLCMGG